MFKYYDSYMIKHITYTILLCLLSFGAIAQIKKSDKTSNSSKIKSNAYNKVNPESLLKKARAIKTTNTTQAIAYVEEALIASKKQQNKSSEANAYQLLGEINQETEHWTEAIDNYNKSILLLPKNSISNLFSLHFNIGLCFKELSNYNKAIASYNIALQNTQLNDNKFKVNNAIGDVYYLQNNISNAQEKYQKALIFAKQNKNSSHISIAKANLAKTYARQGKSKKAELSLEESEEALFFNSDEADDISSYNYEVVTEAQEEVIQQYKNENKTTKELEIRTRSNGISNAVVKDKNPIAKKYEITQNQKLAETYLEDGELEEAINTLNSNIFIADNNQLTSEKAQSQKILSEALVKKGDYKEALEQYKKYVTSKEEELKDIEAKLNNKSAVSRRQKNINFLDSDFELYETEGYLLEEQNKKQQWIILSLIILLLITSVSGYLIYRNAKAKRKANQLLALKTLRSQMNPHFIFNALNSVNNFISKNDERSANKFLSEFSKLMRMVLENSQHDLIPLQDEIQLISLYLKLEHFRFRDKFDYTLNVDNELKDTSIPPMLIQPFIENAVWHGLRYKESFGLLEVSLSQFDNEILVTVKDNGIGRKRSQQIKTTNQEQKSQGLKNTTERIKLINQVYKTNYKLEITDLDSNNEDVGTLVKLKL